MKATESAEWRHPICGDWTYTVEEPELEVQVRKSFAQRCQERTEGKEAKSSREFTEKGSFVGRQSSKRDTGKMVVHVET